ncbi:class I adenylate-forming enzyme family protein [Novosphingobium sp. PASSN1]|uniref:class I adenylate-forming enzyme family protein n=1 Tax=Novosphingobium sp. PASSN1 TaxID=2015561 RepID=UPI000BD07CBD|nr:class I adenylate-forming enzyme family protein [Novosphingobium sp. PASSN1]OYU33601.1 MAG: fatty acid--CoA ligase [Novosphingobium sp. PASSN1]OYU34466.1 MAG: fatty acid--CoA ligase [Novosphingobium sp. PASSN1]
MTEQAPERTGALPAIPPGWPVHTLAEIRSELCAPGMPFEMENLTIRGVPTRVWKNALPDLRAVMAAARTHGAADFLVYGDERVSFDAFHRAVAALMAALAARGVAKGDRVALAMRNLPEWPVAFMAVAALGAIIVPLNAWWTGEELAFALEDSGARMLIADADRWARIGPHAAGLPLKNVVVSRGNSSGGEALEDLIGTPAIWAVLPDAQLPAAQIHSDDPAGIFYTSGTTGRPKGALGTHRNLVTNIMTSAWSGAQSARRRGEGLPEPKPRVILLAVPFFHATAFSATLMGSLAGGSRLVLLHKWDTLEAMRLIQRERVSMTGGVPFIAWQLIEHPERGQFDLSSLEAIAYGGAPSAPELVTAIWQTFGALPGNGWGMTETSATVTHHMAEDYLNRPSSCGPPAPVASLEIRADDGVTVLPPNTVGELWASGPMIVAGYWNRPEATAQTFVDGWVRTGDLAKLDDEGFCTIVDRAKDVIIRGGENIYSIEVENVLYEHPAVTDAALVGIPHRTLGEEPAAVVYLAPGTEASEEELRAFVAARLAGFKVPVRIAFTEATLPRNANGKILKSELRAMLAEG